MDFLKKHYEKILLGAVLLGLAVAVAFLSFKISADRAAFEAKTSSLTDPKVKALTNLDLSMADATLKRVGSVSTLNFSSPNKLFNPMAWQTGPDGLYPLDESHIGPKAVTVTKLKELWMIISLDAVSMLGDVPKYTIGVEREGAPTPRERAKVSKLCSTNSQNEIFTVRQVEGPPEAPTNIVLELRDDGEKINVSTNQPYKRVDGYLADLAYGKQTFNNRRVNTRISLNGEEYNIVAINPNEVVLSAQSNQKKWTIPYNPKSPAGAAP